VQLLQLTDSDGAEEQQPASVTAAAAAAQAAAETAADTEKACPGAVTLPELNMTAGGVSCDSTSCVVLVSQTSVKGKQQVVEDRTSEQLLTAATAETQPAASSEARSAAAAEQSSSVLTKIPSATPAADTDSKAVGSNTVVAAAAATASIPPLSPRSSPLPAVVPLSCLLSNSSLASAASIRAPGPNIGMDAASMLASAGASGAVAAGNASGRYSSAVLAAATGGDAQTSELVREMAVMKKLAHPHVVALHEVSTGAAQRYKQQYAACACCKQWWNIPTLLPNACYASVTQLR
jgi:hypothetical protein